eukprot:3063654-Rhodomonas_salina.9
MRVFVLDLSKTFLVQTVRRMCVFVFDFAAEKKDRYLWSLRFNSEHVTSLSLLLPLRVICLVPPYSTLAAVAAYCTAVPVPPYRTTVLVLPVPVPHVEQAVLTQTVPQYHRSTGLSVQRA